MAEITYLPVHRVPVSSLEDPRLLRRVSKAREPVVIEGYGFWQSSTPFSVAWFLNEFGEIPLSTLVDAGGGETNIEPSHIDRFGTLGAYLRCFMQCQHAMNRPAYGGLYDSYKKKVTKDQCPYLTNLSVSDCFPKMLDFFRSIDIFGKNMIRHPIALGEVFIGPENTGYGELHYDRYHSIVVSYQLMGEKEWTLFHPKYSWALYPHPFEADWFPHYSPIQVEQPDFERYPNFVHAKGLKTTLKPGELLFCPNDWWHDTFNITNNMSIATRMVTPRLFLKSKCAEFTERIIETLLSFQTRHLRERR